MHQLATHNIRALSAGTTESNSGNIRSALARGLPELQPVPDAHDGYFVIVGSGPSLPQFFDEIEKEQRQGRLICAINGAHDFLVGRGLTPDLFVTCDPRETILGNVIYKNPHTTYLIASRANPLLFDYLSDCKVMLWHSFSSKSDAQPPKNEDGAPLAWDDFDPEEECEAFRGHFAIGGGSTSGLRAINIAYVKGYRKLILYGMDSCLAPDKFTKRFSGENIGSGVVVDVVVGGSGRRFFCNGAMAKQATEFQQVISNMPFESIDVKGDGLLAEIMKARKQRTYD